MLYLELSGKLLSRQIKKFLDNLSTITYNTWRVGVTLMQQSSDMRRFLSTAIESKQAAACASGWPGFNQIEDRFKIWQILTFQCSHYWRQTLASLMSSESVAFWAPELLSEELNQWEVWVHRNQLWAARLKLKPNVSQWSLNLQETSMTPNSKILKSPPQIHKLRMVMIGVCLTWWSSMDARWSSCHPLI